MVSDDDDASTPICDGAEDREEPDVCVRPTRLDRRESPTVVVDQLHIADPRRDDPKWVAWCQQFESEERLQHISRNILGSPCGDIPAGIGIGQTTPRSTIVAT